MKNSFTKKKNNIKIKSLVERNFCFDDILEKSFEETGCLKTFINKSSQRSKRTIVGMQFNRDRNVFISKIENLC